MNTRNHFAIGAPNKRIKIRAQQYSDNPQEWLLVIFEDSRYVLTSFPMLIQLNHKLQNDARRPREGRVRVVYDSPVTLLGGCVALRGIFVLQMERYRNFCTSGAFRTITDDPENPAVLWDGLIQCVPETTSFPYTYSLNPSDPIAQMAYPFLIRFVDPNQPIATPDLLLRRKFISLLACVNFLTAAEVILCGKYRCNLDEPPNEDALDRIYELALLSLVHGDVRVRLQIQIYVSAFINNSYLGWI